ncbi:MAG: tRNA pseudouridine(55) synthase TruB [Candidatus Binatia bacterium]
MQSGILLIDKPEGPSSASVVQRVKGILGARKVGHLGTLDPFASGLLPLGVNEGTKIANIFLTAQKSYSGIIGLGIETDTQDSTGKIIEVHHVPSLDEQAIDDLQRAFTGTLWQMPPMFSALKKGGVRLYHLARQGKSVPRPLREIKIAQLSLWKLDSAELGFELVCSKGAYIRTLATDMGRFLGCGAHLKSLRRLSCGWLTLERAVSLAEFESAKDPKRIPLISLNQALEFICQVTLENSGLSRLKMGQQEVLAGLCEPKGKQRLLRLVDSDDNLIALAHWVQGVTGGRWRLLRMFAS